MGSKNYPGICRIELEGYKSFAKKVGVNIKPLTILSGANSSGKSSFMQPLLLMKQTLESGYDPGELLLSGSCVRIDASKTMFSKLSKGTLAPFFSGLRVSEWVKKPPVG
jgi:predicted ATPase